MYSFRSLIEPEEGKPMAYANEPMGALRSGSRIKPIAAEGECE